LKKEKKRRWIQWTPLKPKTINIFEVNLTPTQITPVPDVVPKF
jgi:hypothetical protein